MSASKALFVFPAAAGHINPSFALCRRLVDLGWEVIYLASPDVHEGVTAAGGTFSDVNELGKEFGIADIRAMILSSLADYGPSAKLWAMNFGSVALLKLLPMYISFLQRLAPQLVVYCPVLSQVAHLAAEHLKIPDVSLLTAAGPGYWDAAFAAHGGSAAGLVDTIKGNSANAAAIEGVRSLLKRPGLSLNTAEPLVNEYYTAVNLVSTIPSLADKLNEKDAAFYKSAGKSFEFVGPLLGPRPPDSECPDLLAKVDKALGSGQQVVYVSMGTAVTGNHGEFGWTGMAGSAITGKDLCQTVFRAVFTELSASKLLDPTPLIVVSTGLQPDALEGIEVPANSFCAPSLPQVELLHRAKPALFVTHAGQNSFMEALTVGTPMLLCPGFGDQLATAAKAEQMGVGIKVDRPAKADGNHAKAISDYAAAVVRGLHRMLGVERPSFASKAQAMAEEIEVASGTERAVEICLKRVEACRA